MENLKLKTIVLKSRGKQLVIKTCGLIIFNDISSAKNDNEIANIMENSVLEYEEINNVFYVKIL